jgi:hypothetical protein
VKKERKKERKVERKKESKQERKKETKKDTAVIFEKVRYMDKIIIDLHGITTFD